jgi:hypothetical protein
MFRYSTLASPGHRPAQDASEVIAAARECATWDEVTVVADGREFPRANVSWHHGHGFVVQCFEDAESWGFFLAGSTTLSVPEVDIVLGGQVQEKWPRELFVDSALAVEAPDFFLQTGKQKGTLHWVQTDAFPRTTVWEGRDGREAWQKSQKSRDG